ncbi:Dynamin-like GTPase that mediates homotypic ER fusion [Lobosporangium transversale]|uniref:RHD3/Sey1 n=1 Tax=Lobosporangium transversale TaxID=64571 RepID=A0A1Y2GV22_9FUNG|nr:RHD3/Sey1 [Lobosporangium transversale]KAF9909033.1 Dynamin-like GTPase that mediates homotypic ER fusion [Lobosporangium transversale]ORZ22875.1 RHD3/Sey1 [Lobosporangium transversale]|eukprot:XP_021883429.1 RHD3/Sey1 [Lobosporangium transversale]
MNVVPDVDHLSSRDYIVPDMLDSPIPSSGKPEIFKQEKPAAAQPRLHLINEEQKFSEHLSSFINEKWGLKDSGFNYNLAAVFGSQSTGKSTLLNRLFGTSFDVMSESSRQQTTKGIWISKGKDMKVLIMDVEGTDGRERGEDQDFERKSALFSLATTEVLIVNLWEHQVGLYNGANMGLLKTVFEVNLQLFGGNRGKEKTLLLFVIRDHVGATPLANLSNTLRVDLERIWHGLSKPEGLEDCKITDYFDFMFTTLSHKLLQPEKFEADVDQLRLRFTDPNNPNYVFQPQYSRRVPVDGLHIYAGGIWDKIMTNKDLDLPTQQELLAQYRCDEIASAAFAIFQEKVKEFRQPIESGNIVEDLGPKMNEIRSVAIKSFDKDASRYHAEVYKRKRAEMMSKANHMLEAYFLGQLKNLHKKAVSMFSTKLQNTLRGDGVEFSVAVADSKKEALDYFLQGAKAIKLDETEWSFDEELYQLEQGLKELAAVQREKELNKMLAALEKHLRKELDEPIGLALNNPGPGMWGRVITIYQRTVEDGEQLLQKRARTFDLNEHEQAELTLNLRRQAWVLLTKKVQEESADGMMLLKLRNRFEEKFRYDDHGLPRVWKPDDDIDTPFRKARDETVELVPLFAKINTLDPIKGEKIELEATDDFDFDQSLKVLSESRQQEITNKFKRESDAFYLEAKRSVVATQAKLPYWVGVALVILGWNEFIAVIKNPLYLMVLAMVGVPMAAMWYLDMLGLVETVAWKVYDQGYKIAMDKLREAMDKSHEGQGKQQNQQQHHQQCQPQQFSSQSQLNNRFVSRSDSFREENGVELDSLDKKSL